MCHECGSALESGTFTWTNASQSDDTSPATDNYSTSRTHYTQDTSCVPKAIPARLKCKVAALTLIEWAKKRFLCKTNAKLRDVVSVLLREVNNPANYR